ncbi:MAG: glucose-6-phosphate dehydrogenase, partial [Bacteroidia bacterium]|nr:glucose-6-phosphate dehydrogenase [Bacteroidia bacterium]
MNKPENQILVIFGASGDLTKRKLIPALYSLEVQDLLPEKFAIIGVSRSGLNNDQFRRAVEEGLQQFSEEKDKTRITSFLQKIYYQSVDAQDNTSFIHLAKKLSDLQNSLSIPPNTIYYLSS